MKKSYLYSGVALVTLAGAGAAYYLTNNKDNEPKTFPVSATNSSHNMNGMDHSTMSNSPDDAEDIIDLTSQNKVEIDIKDFAYSKKNIKIKKGTTVIWTNRDIIQHNVMAEHKDSDVAHDAQTSLSADSLNGPMLNQGESYMFTFNKVDTTPYHCSPHPDMKGNVYVVDAE